MSFPSRVDQFVDAVDHLLVVDLDGEFAAAVEAAGREVDGADDGARIVGEKQLGMQLECFSLWTLTPTSSRMRRPLTPSMSFSFFRLCGGRAMMWILTPRRCAHQVFDDGRVLVALVL